MEVYNNETQASSADKKPLAIKFASPKRRKRSVTLDTGASLPGNMSVFEFNRRYRTKGPAFYAQEKAQ